MKLAEMEKAFAEGQVVSWSAQLVGKTSTRTFDLRFSGPGEVVHCKLDGVEDTDFGKAIWDAVAANDGDLREGDTQRSVIEDMWRDRIGAS